MSYQAPRGTQDILPEKIGSWQRLEKIIKAFCDLYRYEEIRTPVFEDTSVFKRENDSSDMVNKEMYSFTMGSDNLTLRPEGTAGVIRSFVQHKLFGSMELPVKLYYMGEMFRHERPQKGRYRQFNQFGVENIGIKSPLADAEIIAFGYSLIKALGITEVSVLVNTLGDNLSREEYKSKLKEHFKNDLGCLCEDCKRRYQQNPLRILDCKVDKDLEVVKNAPSLSESLNDESKKYFEEVLKALDDLNIPYKVDDKLVRGLDYYSHTVFEVVSTHSESGAQSTLLAGGRYDNLVSYFGGPELSGVGFAAGMERLLLTMELENIKLEEDNPLDVYIISLSNTGNYPLNVATMCRAYGFSCEINMIERSMKSQFKSVERKKAKNVIIIGEDEVKNNKVNIKNIETQKQIVASYDEIIDVLEEFMEGDHHE